MATTKKITKSTTKKKTKRIPKKKLRIKVDKKHEDLATVVRESTHLYPIDPKDPKDRSLVEFQHERIETLIIEWIISFPDASISYYLKEIKGYSDTQYEQIIKQSPKDEWYSRKAHFQDKIVEQLSKRHIDIIAEVNDQQARAGKLSFAKCLEYITKGVPVVYDEDNTKKGVKKGDISYYKAVSAKELKTLIDGIKTSQGIYRTAVGLPTDGEGMIQVLEKLSRFAPHNNSIVVNESEMDKNIKELTYDEIKIFIDKKRKMLNNEEK